MKTENAGKKGFSLVETMTGMLIMLLVCMAVFNALKSVSTTTDRGKDRAFATQKAVQMIEEMRALVEDPQGKKSIKTLDDYDNSPVYKNPSNFLRYVLTTRAELNDPNKPGDPGDPLSGNPQKKFIKHIEVSSLEQEVNARKVRVRVLSAKNLESLAEVAGVLRTLGSENNPTQAYDLYVIAIENVPGWWISLQDLVPMFTNMLQDVVNRNPGLSIRTHWITRLSYGRDPFYAPYVNSAVRSDALDPAAMRVYYYPGNVAGFDGGDSISRYYYVPQNLGGRYSLDGAVQQPANFAYANPSGLTSSMADQFNHAVRYPDEETAYNASTAAARAEGLPPPEMSLRMFLEKMNTNPNQFQNAMIVNLHGELLPVPPLRNYSDPAMRPETPAINAAGTNGGLQKVRAVTHPQKLRYDADPPAVDLRVYSFVTNPNDPNFPSSDASPGNPEKTIQVMVQISSLNLVAGPGNPSPPTISVLKLNGNSVNKYEWIAAVPGAPNDYVLTNLPSNVVAIKLNNSPVRHEVITTGANKGRGLPSESRLYGMEYIPSSTNDTGFSVTEGPFPADLPGSLTDLTVLPPTLGANPDKTPKNTARWIIRVKRNGVQPIPNGIYTITTRMGTAPENLLDPAIGTLANQPYNNSRTYTWVGLEPPVTERYQFLGDPRHMPYDDLKSGALNEGLNYGTRFNWFFLNFDPSTRGYKGYSALNPPNWSLWSSYANSDVPRFMQIYREGIMKCSGIWCSITGYSYFYMGMGGEMGYDRSNRFTNSLRIRKTPWAPDANPADDPAQGVDEITSNTNGGNTPHNMARIISKSNGTWYGKSWIGELFPDSEFNVPGPNNDWSERGNLPVGMAGYRRALFSSVGLPDSQKRLNRAGCGTFFNNWNGDNRFNHDWPPPSNARSNGDLSPGNGDEVAQTFRFPLLNTIPASRPFQLQTNTAILSPERNSAPYNYGNPSNHVRTAMSILETIYQTRGGLAGESSSAIVRFSTVTAADPPSNSVGTAVINGLSPQGDTGTGLIGKISLIGLLRGFLAAGAPHPPGNSTLWLSSRVVQLPLIVSTSPAPTDEILDPLTIPVFWYTNWQKWDGGKYTNAYPDGFAETVPLHYNVKVSRDNGRTWFFPQDNAPALEGVLDTDHGVVWSPPPGNRYLWNVSNISFDSGYPQGPYIFRIECYRQGLPLHYSFHQIRVFIKRTS